MPNVLPRAAAMVLLLASGGCATTPPSPPAPGEVLQAVPEAPDRTARYAIYLHDVTLDNGPDAQRLARLDRVTRALAAAGLTVIAEVRPLGTIQKVPDDLDRYAQKVAGQVRSLLAADVAARRINVVGYSRGAVLAMMTATHTADRRVGFVILAGCMNDSGRFREFAPVLMRYAEKFAGNFLSIIEQSDPDFGTCAPYFAKASPRPAYAESMVQTGKGHAFAAEPEPAWVQRVVTWIRERD
jgi:pimeloyl-ACP methyl ester carboxylesterase